MVKKKITFTNLDDVEVTEEFHFNLTKAEIIELDLKYDGGLEGFAERISASKDQMEIYNEFKQLLLISIGRRQGNSFIKTQQIRDEFASSEAYSELLIEMLNDASVAADFFNGIMPAQIRLEVAKQAASVHPDQGRLQIEIKTLDEFENERRLFMHENAGAEFPDHLKSYKLTVKELTALDTDELKSGLATGKYEVPKS